MSDNLRERIEAAAAELVEGSDRPAEVVATIIGRHLGVTMPAPVTRRAYQLRPGDRIRTEGPVLLDICRYQVCEVLDHPGGQEWVLLRTISGHVTLARHDFVEVLNG